MTFKQRRWKSANYCGKRGDLLFIDYLKAISSEFTEDMHYVGFLRTHRDFIKQKLARYRDTQSIVSKYVWLAEYHNAVVDEVIDKTFLESWELDEDLADALKIELRGYEANLF
jgi:hypothetical protein